MSFANVIGVVRKRAGLPGLDDSELSGAELGDPGLAGPELGGPELGGPDLGGPDTSVGQAVERLAGDGAQEVAGNKAELSYR